MLGRLWQFLFSEKIESQKDSDHILTFVPTKISHRQLVRLSVGDYVNLWRSDKNADVVIFSPGGVGGSGYLGIVPPRYSARIRRHLDECHQTDLSSYYYYDAEVTEISAGRCVIRVVLYSKETRDRMVQEDLVNARAKTAAAFEKKYTLRKPVKLRFDLLQTNLPASNEVRLKTFDKEVYLNDPYNCPIELVSTDGIVIGRTISQKSECFRVIRAYYSGHVLNITGHRRIANQLLVEIEGKKIESSKQ